MKIAQIVPTIERTPPKKYGGTERVAYALTEELVARGHEVTLFATGDSITSAHLKYIHPKSLREAGVKNLYGYSGHNSWTLAHVGYAYEMQHMFDIIHDHTDFASFALAHCSKTPVVVTLHNVISPEDRLLFDHLSNPYYVLISQAQGKYLRKDHTVGVVHNGLDLGSYPFSSQHDGYLLYVGQLTPFKGAHRAVQIARRTGLPLILAAKLEDQYRNYFDTQIKPYLNQKIVWIGEVNEAQRNSLMKKALCFLHPISWREPFGLTLIEAMACGCPVVAYNSGSIPEIVWHKKTGYVVNSIDEAVQAVGRIDRIDRALCRSHVLKHFSTQIMTDEYEAVYSRILDQAPHKTYDLMQYQYGYRKNLPRRG